MVDVIVVMRSNGILRPEITRDAAARAGLELPSACAMIMGETGGGRMIYGHDTRSTGGIYTPGGPVTPDNYRAFRTAQRAGRIPRNGVGDAQLTSEEFVARAEQIGGPAGPADPFTNQLSGFIGLAARQKQRGIQDGFRSYNGSGPLAEKYGREKKAARDTWAQRLAGAAPTSGAPAPSGSGAGSIPRLEEGDSGPAVVRLQTWLNRTFPAYSSIDVGPQRYGPQTVAVLAEFQRRSGVAGGDGRNVGPATAAALWAAGYRP